MNPQIKPPDTTLRISRTFGAPRERVFSAWTEEEQILQWWGPEGASCVSAECDLRVGGKYRIEIREEQGGIYIVGGEFTLVEPPERLAYTWRWEQWTKEVPETIVTVEFHDRGGATELILTHERFDTAATRDDHNQGWSSCLDCLEKHLA